jgi:predicted amidohydrolase
MKHAVERVVISEDFLAQMHRQYPALTRGDILSAIVRAGPNRRSVDIELLQISARRAARRGVT